MKRKLFPLVGCLVVLCGCATVTQESALGAAIRELQRTHLPLPHGYTTRIEATDSWVDHPTPVWSVHFYRPRPEHGRREMYDIEIHRQTGRVHVVRDIRATGGRDDPPLPGYSR